MAVLLGPGARVYGGYQDDAHDDGDEGGPQVVGDGENAHAAAGLGVHRRQT